jgi:Iron-containing redox enzyme
MNQIPELEQGVTIQAQTMLGTRFIEPTSALVSQLYEQYWPPVPVTDGLSVELRKYLTRSATARAASLCELRADDKAYGKFLHESLGDIYAHLFGYRDGVATSKADDALEIALLTAKIELEREFLDYWIGSVSVPSFASQDDAADYLDQLARINPGVHHPLFDYLRKDAPPEQFQQFLLGEAIRNEVVDDEVAMLVTGLQGTQKAVAAANLWDECGRGRLENFHTFWLRRLVNATDGSWDGFSQQRESNPWFAKITSNTNNMLLTRPAYKQMAYGCFMIFESWVEPHFQALLGAMDRFDMNNQDIRIYFDAHIAVDPRHSGELSDGIRYQRPELNALEIHDIVCGAHMAVVAGCRQYDLWLAFFMQSVEGTK